MFFQRTARGGRIDAPGRGGKKCVTFNCNVPAHISNSVNSIHSDLDNACPNNYNRSANSANSDDISISSASSSNNSTCCSEDKPLLRSSSRAHRRAVIAKMKEIISTFELVKRDELSFIESKKDMF
jgi:hypothetical protein